MDELVKLVTDKAGISPDQAQKAVTAVIGFLKEKLPAPLAGQLDKFTSGGAASAGGPSGVMDEAMGAAGGFMGKK